MRTKEFDPEEVENAVMQVFWRKGFAVTSIQDLVELRDLNIDNVSACIVGKAIIEGKITERDVSEFL